MIRNTKQREAIRRAIREAGRPLSAAEVLDSAGLYAPGLGMATVYRTLSALLDDAKAANCDGVLSVQLTPGAPADRAGTAQFTLLDVKRIVSAAAIDGDALAAELSERNPMPKGSAPKL